MKNYIIILVLLVSVRCASADLTYALNGYWKVDGDLTDSSVKSNDLPRSYEHIFDATDKVGNSTHSFATTTTNGGGGVITAKAHVDLSATYALSMSCWFKWDETPGETQLVSYMSKWGGSKSDRTKYFNLYSYGSDRIDLNLGNVYNYTHTLIVTDLTINNGSWYHLAVTLDTTLTAGQDNMFMYLTEEGASSVQQVGSMEWDPSDGAGGTSKVINYENNGWFNILPSWQSFLGNADEFRFYSQRALSTADVQEIYDLEVVPAPASGTIMIIR